jgi:predicted transcriptional regulator of viral defense system
MNKLQAIQILKEFDKKGKFVFTRHDLAKLFSNDEPKAMSKGIQRLVKSGLIKHVCKGIYVNSDAQCFDSYTIEHIAKALRRNKYNYVSLESILSEYGLISQIPLDRLTVMTTGREGIYKTTYGVIEFTHTRRSVENILKHIQTIPNRPLRIATQEAAVRDLKRVGRNLHLLQRENINDE